VSPLGLTTHRRHATTYAAHLLEAGAGGARPDAGEPDASGAYGRGADGGGWQPEQQTRCAVRMWMCGLQRLRHARSERWTAAATAGGRPGQPRRFQARVARGGHAGRQVVHRQVPGGAQGGWRTPFAYNSHCPASPLWPAGAPSGWPKRRTSTCVGRAHLTGLATLIRQEPHVQGCGGHPHTARGARHQDPVQKKWVLGLKGFGGVHYKGSIQRTPGQAPNPSIHHPTGLTPWTNKRGPEWTLQPTSPARSRTATLIISTVCWMAGVFVHEGEPAGAAMRLQQHSGARAAGESSFSFSSSPPPSFQLSAHNAVGFMRRIHQGTKPSETEEE